MKPIIDMPTRAFKIPSSGEEITVRPFTRKEEKLLLMAAESGESKTVVETVKQVINNCIVSGKFDVDNLPFFDVDFLFIFLRAFSIGETVELKLTCNNDVAGNTCGNVIPVHLDISKAEMQKNDSISKDIKMNNKVGIIMKYPTYSLMKTLEDKEVTDQKTEIIVSSIDYVYDEKGIYKIGPDFTKKDMTELIEGLTESNYKKLEEYVDNFPVFVVNLETTCNKCGFEHKIQYSDFYDFFFY